MTQTRFEFESLIIGIYLGFEYCYLEFNRLVFRGKKLYHLKTKKSATSSRAGV
jgi:hypothetical protein